MSNTIEIGMRLFGDAHRWCEKDYLLEKGASNVHMDVEIEWIRLITDEGRTQVSTFQRNHQQYAPLVANAIVRHFNNITVPLTAQHYLHAPTLTPKDVKARLASHPGQQWISRIYNVDGSNQQVSIAVPAGTKLVVLGLPSRDEMTKPWQIAYLSSRLPQVRDHVQNEVKLLDNRPDEHWYKKDLRDNASVCYLTTTLNYRDVLPLTENAIRIAIGKNGAALNDFISKYHTHYCEVLQDEAIDELITRVQQGCAPPVIVKIDEVLIPFSTYTLLDDSKALLLNYQPKDGLKQYDRIVAFEFKFYGTLSRSGVFPFYVARPSKQLLFTFDAQGCSDISIHAVYEHQLPRCETPHTPKRLTYDKVASTGPPHPQHARLDILYGKSSDKDCLPPMWNDRSVDHSKSHRRRRKKH